MTERMFKMMNQFTFAPGEYASPFNRFCLKYSAELPMKGKITSLNASAAASILLYEAVRQRLG